MSFTYDDNGLRTSKTVNGFTTEYYWNGNLLAAEKSPNYVIIYNYDASGRPIGMAYRESTYTQYQWDIYWFDLNLHGDVVAIYDTDGVKMVTYSYDAWGKCTASYYNGGASTSATKNNLRYRSYYYDTDLGLYYLQSRYYDANTCRFISPDALMSGANGSLHGLNLYVYCFNNPINMTDSQGDWPTWNEFWNRTTEILFGVIEAYITSLEYDAGIGQGLSVAVESFGFEAFRDTYVGFDNGKLVSGNKAVAGLGIFVFGISYEADHRTYSGGDNLKLSSQNSDGPLDMLNYSETDKSLIILCGPFSLDSDFDLRISFNSSAHIFFGGHFSAGFNFSEFIRRIQEI